MNHHPQHRMHANSISANNERKRSGSDKRRVEVVRQVFTHTTKPRTDRELFTAAHKLGLTSTDQIRELQPTISTIVKDGLLAEIDRVADKVTGRKVRRTYPV